jgi:hypothetical protein
MHSADATFVNVYWLLAGNPGDPTVMATDFFDSYDTAGGSGSSMRHLQSQDLQLDGADITLLDGVTPTVQVLRASTTHGAVLTQSSSANSSLVLTWETGIRGRSNRGRTFLPGIPSASLETGSARWSSALITDANLWVANFIAALNASTSNLQLLVVSQHAAGGPHHHPVTDFIPRQGVGTQRRRTERAKP